jgi:hypothetical protein
MACIDFVQRAVVRVSRNDPCLRNNELGRVLPKLLDKNTVLVRPTSVRGHEMFTGSVRALAVPGGVVVAGRDNLQSATYPPCLPPRGSP